MKATLIIIIIVAITMTACTELQVIEKNRILATNTTINITNNITIYNNTVNNITNNITYTDDNNITINVSTFHVGQNINVTICRLDGTCFSDTVVDYEGIETEVDPVWTANMTYVYGNDTNLWNAIMNISMTNETDPNWQANSTLVAYLNASNFFYQTQTINGSLNMTNNSIYDVDVLYVHNITGRSPIIITNDLIGTGTNFFADNFYGNFNGTNGTIFGVTINNGTIVNLHVVNESFFDANIYVNGTVNATDYNLYGDDIWIYKDNRVFYFNVSKLSEYILNASNMTILLPSQPYLYNDSQYIYFNETKLNSTINIIAKNQVRTYNFTLLSGSSPTPVFNELYNESTVSYTYQVACKNNCADVYVDVVEANNSVTVWKFTNDAYIQKATYSIVNNGYTLCAINNQDIYLNTLSSGTNYILYYNETSNQLQHHYNYTNPPSSTYLGCQGATFQEFHQTGVYRNSSDGINWVNISTGNAWNTLNAQQKYTSSNQQYVFVSDYSTAYISNDYGVTYNTNSNVTQTQGASISSSGQYMLADGDNGNIYVSNDYGVTFTTLVLVSGDAGSASSMSDNGQYMVVTTYGVGFNGQGYIHYSTNYGVNWSSIFLNDVGMNYGSLNQYGNTAYMVGYNSTSGTTGLYKLVLPSTSGGGYSGISNINISYQITQITVLPTSNTTSYRFELLEYPNYNVIDRDRTPHKNVWNIEKSYAINNKILANITQSNPDDTFNVIVKYIYNGVTP